MEGDERDIVVERTRAGFPAHGLKQALRFRKAGHRRIKHMLEEILHTPFLPVSVDHFEHAVAEQIKASR